MSITECIASCVNTLTLAALLGFVIYIYSKNMKK